MEDTPICIVKEVNKKYGVVTFSMIIDDHRPDLKEGCDELRKIGYKYKVSIYFKILRIKLKLLVYSQLIPTLIIDDEEL